MLRNTVKTLFLVLLTMVFATSCDDSPKPAISFYYWRTTFNLSDAESKSLKDNNVNRLYLRFFDLDTADGIGVVPRAPILFDQTPKTNVVPVIFIKNQVFQSRRDNSDLARKTVELIATIEKSAGLKTDEIQLDCDWTPSTREAYFKFIASVKSISGKKISATIRLHQIKYPEKTGVPNADRGVLMYYNMSKIEAGERNSIYDQKTAKRYLASAEKYPLKLDVALPIYGWGIHLRDGRPIGLKRKDDLVGLEHNRSFRQSSNQLEVLENHYFHGTFYKKGDLLKMESVSEKQLKEIADDLSNAGLKPSEIIFYDLDEFNLNRYEKDIFSETAGRF